MPTECFKPQDRTEERNEFFLILFADDRLLFWIFRDQLVNQLGISRLMLVAVVIAEIIGVVVFQFDNTSGFLVAEERDGVVGFLLQITEADDISVCLDGI